MDQEKCVFIVESDAFIGAAVLSFLESSALEMGFQVVPHLPDVDIPAAHIINLVDFSCGEPLRVGRLVDRIATIQNSNGADLLIPIGSYRLDIQQSLMISAGDVGPIRLTEKEVYLLEILYAQNGGSISRDVLLEKVWGYADGIETHTLETHIYRLRQKIEEDPSAPHILMTDDAGGYFLNLE